MGKVTQQLVVLGVSLLIGTLAIAKSSGSEGYFTIHNNTTDNIVIGFYTNDGGGWSSNWLSDDLEPGNQASAEFFANTGNCDQLFRVGWLGDNDSEVLDEEISINICEASNVYLDDNEIYFD